MSSRSRGETPYAVANRRKIGEKSSVANSESDCSDRTFDDAYAVSGASGAVSSTAVFESDAPYMLHEDANTKRSIPAARASSASRTPARWLIVVRQRLVEIAERVVRERREMDDGIDSLEVGRLDVANVATDLRRGRCRQRLEVAAVVERRCRARRPRGRRPRARAAQLTDVTVRACEEDAHFPPIVGGVLRVHTGKKSSLSLRSRAKGSSCACSRHLPRGFPRSRLRKTSYMASCVQVAATQVLDRARRRRAPGHVLRLGTDVARRRQARFCERERFRSVSHVRPIVSISPRDTSPGGRRDKAPHKWLRQPAQSTTPAARWCIRANPPYHRRARQ